MAWVVDTSVSDNPKSEAFHDGSNRLLPTRENIDLHITLCRMPNGHEPYDR